SAAPSSSRRPAGAGGRCSGSRGTSGPLPRRTTGLLRPRRPRRQRARWRLLTRRSGRTGSATGRREDASNVWGWRIMSEPGFEVAAAYVRVSPDASDFPAALDEQVGGLTLSV